MKLVIVESPTKANTIKRFLSSDFEVNSSYGHVRDLPEKKLGVDIKHDFKPLYVTIPKAKKRIQELKQASRKALLIYFATDQDREGEAIAWHLVSALKPKKEKIKRITFHEITKNAIINALKNPQEIDMGLVNAQQARRILDRLVGYKLSPFLWRKVRKGLSAGRVQSVAVRLIVDREREIERFKPEEYWTIETELKKQESLEKFIAKFIKQDDKTIPKLGIRSKDEAQKIIKDLKGAIYKVVNIEKKEVKKSPYPPYTTSTLQQDAANRLGFSAKFTMMLAQQLYEGIELGARGSVGLITYHRTDSLNLADQALKEAREIINRKYGENYLPSEPRHYKTKSKLAQEAHEAIRPTGFSRTPEDIKKYLDERQYKLYKLIWQRALASQMKEAILDSTTVDIEAKNYTFRATGSVIKFDGFTRIYPLAIKENILPPLEKEEMLNLIKLIPSQHFTQPPSRFTEASLVKTLEKNGIGRPSTYAPIISTIQERGYVKREKRYFYPEEIGILVNDLLVKHFPNIVDIKFTAHMEDDLDEIAKGEKKWARVVGEFYEPFSKNLRIKEKEISKKELTEQKTNKLCPKCGKSLVIKLGKFGKFLACSGFPECKYTEPIGEEKELKEKYSGEVCDKCGAKMVVKYGKFGPFLACSNYPKCKNIKPIVKSTGIKCPKCGQGEIVEKKSKKGRIFYACNKYPKCKFALWQKPTGEKCPKCGSLLAWASKNKIKCSNKECRYEKEVKVDK